MSKTADIHNRQSKRRQQKLLDKSGEKFTSKVKQTASTNTLFHHLTHFWRYKRLTCVLSIFKESVSFDIWNQKRLTQSHSVLYGLSTLSWRQLLPGRFEEYAEEWGGYQLRIGFSNLPHPSLWFFADLWLEGWQNQPTIKGSKPEHFFVERQRINIFAVQLTRQHKLHIRQPTFLLFVWYFGTGRPRHSGNMVRR